MRHRLLKGRHPGLLGSDSLPELLRRNHASDLEINNIVPGPDSDPWRQYLSIWGSDHLVTSIASRISRARLVSNILRQHSPLPWKSFAEEVSIPKMLDKWKAH